MSAKLDGWVFVEIDGRGKPVRSGTIVSRLSTTHFLVQFNAGASSHARAIAVPEMVSWNMFPDTIELSRFMESQNPPASAVPATPTASQDSSETLTQDPRGDSPSESE